jgi:hypothetical protein
MEVAKDIPGSKQGRFTLGTKRADNESARKLVDQIDLIQQLGGTTGVAPQFPEPKPTPPKPAPPKPAPSEFQNTISQWSSKLGLGEQANPGRQDVIDALKIPRIGLLVIGIIHLALSAKGLLQSESWQTYGPFETSLINDFDVTFYLPSLEATSFKSLVMFGVGILMLMVASRLRHPRNYVFVYAALIGVILAPVHVAYLLTLVFSIWALVVLSDNRCRAVYFESDQQRSRKEFWPPSCVVSLVLMVVVSVASFVVLVALGYLLLTYTGSPSGSPIQPRAEQNSVESSDAAGTTMESESSTKDDSKQAPNAKSDKDAAATKSGQNDG